MDKVDLIHATPIYALVRFPGGREATVPLKEIAPTPSAVPPTSFDNTGEGLQRDTCGMEAEVDDEQTEVPLKSKSPCGFPVNASPYPEFRRSSRVRKPIGKYGVPYY